ncbi:P-type conjugative transfer protein TrbJ [Stakelama sp. CBK3Z-3]|uniref:P-type conjugative transfer protein TrbJ n=1 Tax=Stakelama flava TaxID=2860338 RepID=A0ABS6XLT6_9SPHN|nr:P-type conjugative transfer protein TrbJ [Stakelama flava]MBW4331116.1 P-type conjugative transfer protein TrbJ [Stakelama flava]
MSLRTIIPAALLFTGTVMLAPPAAAQITVFDPSNYSQNLLTAARTLQQINNQIQSLQNEAAMLQNMAKNLKPTDFPQLAELNRRLEAINALMDEAQAIDFRIDGLDEQFRSLFPDFDAQVRADARASEARARLDAAMAGFRQTMGVQAQVVENVADDARTLAEISARSQGAEGAMQLGQTTNQLLALATKQQLQIQNLLAAQFRAEAFEAARRAQAEADARAATKKFLGTGSAYTPR